MLVSAGAYDVSGVSEFELALLERGTDVVHELLRHSVVAATGAEVEKIDAGRSRDTVERGGEISKRLGSHNLVLGLEIDALARAWVGLIFVVIDHHAEVLAAAKSDVPTL